MKYTQKDIFDNKVKIDSVAVDMARLKTRLSLIECVQGGGHYDVYLRVPGGNWASAAFVFQCSECGKETIKTKGSLAKAEHAYLVSLGLLQPKKKQGKAKPK